jgi:hypothetical protein
MFLLAAALAFGTIILRTDNARSQACQAVFSDGDFTNTSIWTTQSNGTYPLIDGFRYRSAPLAAHLAGVNNAMDKISTTVTLPSDTPIFLEYWWYVDTIDDDDDAGFDYLTVEIADTFGNTLKQFQPYITNYNAESYWQSNTANLDNYAGQTIQIQFVAQTDERNISDFYIDDVTVTACDWDFSLFLPLSQN